MKWPESKYQLVYADPPWPFYGDPKKNAAAGKHYKLMTVKQIYALPMKSIMTKKAALLLWVPCAKLHLAIYAIDAWGLYFRGKAYVWVKTRKDGKPIKGQGVPPTYTKPTTEDVLLATTCRTGRPFPIHDLAQEQVVYAPRRAHSEKPEEVRKLIEKNCGDVSKIELFARKTYPGWASFGDEIEVEI